MCVLQSGQVPPVGDDPVRQRPEHALREQQHTSAVGNVLNVLVLTLDGPRQSLGVES